MTNDVQMLMLIVPFLYYQHFTETSWAIDWKEDNIATNLSCLTNDSNCFANNQETIIIDNKESNFDGRNPCIFPFKHLNTTYQYEL